MQIKNEVDISKSNTNRLKEMFKDIQKKCITTGINKKDNKRYPNSDTTTAEVGTYQEFGTTTLPPRIWLRIFNVYQSYKKDMHEQIIKIANRNDNFIDILTRIGEYQKETIKNRIKKNQVRPASKKNGITLIDTGQLVNSIDYEVKDV